MADKLDIPDACFEVKALYREEPSSALVREIKAFIAMTGQPYMWHGHTHTKPPSGSLPKYLDDFELHERFVRLGKLSPCPCCWPRHTKYGRGKIAWFPSEGVIRLMGDHCFRSLDKDAHESAEIELRNRKTRDADIAYLLKHGDRLRQTHDTIVAAQQVSDAAWTLSKQLKKTFNERLDLPLWRHIQHGTLPIWTKFTEVVGDGNIVERTGSRSYAAVRGHRLLNPNYKPHSLVLRQSAQAFRVAFDHDDWTAFVEGCSDEYRRQMAKLIDSASKRARDIFIELGEMQQFTSEVNVATIRAWGRHDDNPVPFFFERDGRCLRIGKTPNVKMPVTIPIEFEQPLGVIDLPTLKEFKDTASST